MKIYLIAEKLSHSYSPLIHKMLADYDYELKELMIDELKDFMLERNFDGLNVTIPYKTEVIKYLDELSPEAQKLNSVNTVLNKNGKLIGYNTDYYGFMHMVNQSNIDFNGKKVLVIGNGGASKTIQSALLPKKSIRSILQMITLLCCRLIILCCQTITYSCTKRTKRIRHIVCCLISYQRNTENNPNTNALLAPI